ncbi:MAG: Rpn family recombination-promoting nuclease/putative transposase [Chthoniobacterales bacterium]|nr:Rpn family recombination-promoting nuclease/putative transposase [Chthoniobacterales bacterium]
MPKKPNSSPSSDDSPSNSITHPHDRLFRKFMSNPLAVVEFLKEYFPSVAEKVDPGSLRPVDGVLIGKDLQEQRTDFLSHATFQGNPGYLYLLVEHQSTPDRLMPLRMMEYFFQIIRRDLQGKDEGAPFPIIVPCIIYNGKKPYSYTTSFFKMFANPELAKSIVSNPFPLTDLSQIPDKELKKAPLIGFMNMLLKHAAEQDAIALVRELSPIIKFLEKANQLDLLEAGVYYLVTVNKNDVAFQDVFKEFQKHITPRTQEHVMTIAESLIDEGLQKGLQKGRQEGRQEGLQEGEATLLIKLLKRRFGVDAVERYLMQIRQADSEQLSRWGENFIDAQSIEDVFSYNR